MLNLRTLGYVYVQYLPALLEVLPALLPYLPYVLYVLPFILGLVALFVRGHLQGFAHKTVAAVYRAAIHAANELQDTGLEWLRSSDGIAFRLSLAGRAYDALPERVGPIPVGLVRIFVSREQFCQLVEQAFQEMTELAECLELPEEL